MLQLRSWECITFASMARHIRPDFLFSVVQPDFLDFTLKIEYFGSSKFATFSV